MGEGGGERKNIKIYSIQDHSGVVSPHQSKRKVSVIMFSDKGDLNSWMETCYFLVVEFWTMHGGLHEFT